MKHKIPSHLLEGLNEPQQQAVRFVEILSAPAVYRGAKRFLDTIATIKKYDRLRSQLENHLVG